MKPSPYFKKLLKRIEAREHFNPKYLGPSDPVPEGMIVKNSEITDQLSRDFWSEAPRRIAEIHEATLDGKFDLGL